MFMLKHPVSTYLDHLYQIRYDTTKINAAACSLNKNVSVFTSSLKMIKIRVSVTQMQGRLWKTLTFGGTVCKCT